jgi:hypothetical protein
MMGQPFLSAILAPILAPILASILASSRHSAGARGHRQAVEFEGDFSRPACVEARFLNEQFIYNQYYMEFFPPDQK